MSERAPRIYVPEPLSSGGRFTVSGDRHHYLSRVLRLKPGAAVVAFDGTGGEYEGRITEVQRASSTVETGDFRAIDRESILHVELAQGIGRGERTDIAIQKAVELGVASIVPLLTRRGVVRLDADRATRRLEHWRGIIVHACQQCGRNRLPELRPVAPLEDWLAERERRAADLMLDPDAGTRLADLDRPDISITLLIGPEGGLDATERRAALDAGFTGVAMGPRILRTETAAIAAMAALQSLWGDL